MKYFVKLGMLFGTLVVVSVLFIIGMVKIPEWTSQRRIEDVEQYAVSVDEIVIPENAVIVGIGEATHGNVEFQMVKLNLLKNMVAQGSCRSIVFEMPVGDGMALNDCVHDLNGDAKEAVHKLSYPLYCTDEMVELVDWVKAYNQTVPEEEMIHIYGIDMQNAGLSAYRVAEYMTAYGMEELDDIGKQRIKEICENYEGLIEGDRVLFEDIVSILEKRYREEKDEKIWQVLYNAQTVLQVCTDHVYFDEDADGYSDYRDECMLVNMQRILTYERERGFGRILLTAHNGHLMRGDSMSFGTITLGERIAQEYQEGYFVIGTDFFYANVNIHTNNADANVRENHRFCSADVLAAQAKNMTDGRYYLDFSTISDTHSELYGLLHQKGYMGMVGEGYNIFTKLFLTYRVEVVPTDRYDAVIYVYEANPINPKVFVGK